MKLKAFVLSTLCAAGLFACYSSLAQNYNPAINFPKGELNTLSDQEKADGWKLLFNGKDFEGWDRDEGRYAGEWTIENGVIISQKGTTHLFSQKKYKNLDLSWDVCAYDVATPKIRYGNSGVFVRGIKSGQAFPRGYEVQVDPYDVKNPTGGVYGHNPGTLLVDENGNWKPAAFKEVHEGKWIHQRVRVENDHIEVWVNGEKTMDWVDPQKSFMEAGYIALQNHHPTDVVLFTNIKIKEMD